MGQQLRDPAHPAVGVADDLHLLVAQRLHVVEGEAAAIHVPAAFEAGLQRLDELARRGGGLVEVRRIAEHVQVDAELMVELKIADVVPGQEVQVGAISRFGEAVPVSTVDAGSTTIAANVAHAVLVRAR